MKKKMVAIILTIALLLGVSSPVAEASTILMPVPKQQFFDSNGNPLNGGKLYTCVVGVTCDSTTTTYLKNTYTDSTGSTPNSNPVVLDSAGRASVWLSGYYKMALYSSSGTLVWSVDNVSSTSGVQNTWEVDATNYGTGTFTDATIDACLTAIGTVNKTVVVLKPGTWVISGSKNWAAYTNVIFKIPTGSTLSHGAYTIAMYNPPEAGPYQIFSGAGAVTITGYPQEQAWWGSTERLDVTGLKVGSNTFPTYGYPQYQSQLLNNVGFTATVSSKALTVALKGVDGNDPSATNAVSIGFRNGTITSGSPVIRNITSALSVTLSSGSTLGFTSAELGKIYIWAVDTGSGVVLGLSRYADKFLEGSLNSTTAEGGAGGADSSSIMYTTIQQTSKPVRCIGYIEITTGSTPGEWDNAPSLLQVMGPGIKRTGEVVQEVYYYRTNMTTGTTAIPHDDTKPQITEGNEVIPAQTIVPTSAANLLVFTGFIDVYSANAGWNTAAFFKDGGADAVGINLADATGAFSTPLVLNQRFKAGSTASTSYTVRVGNSAGNVCTINGANGTAHYDGLSTTWLSIKEICQ